MHKGVLYYREGWNAWYRDKESLSSMYNPYDRSIQLDKYKGEVWFKGYTDARTVNEITGESGQFWGRMYVPNPIETKIYLAMLASMALSVVVGVVTLF